MSWNGYPLGIRNFLINKLKLKYKSSPSTTIATSDADLPKVWVRLPYLGKRGESLVKSYVSKIRRYLQNPIKFIVVYGTENVSYYVDVSCDDSKVAQPMNPELWLVLKSSSLPNTKLRFLLISKSAEHHGPQD